MSPVSPACDEEVGVAVGDVAHAVRTRAVASATVVPANKPMCAFDGRLNGLFDLRIILLLGRSAELLEQAHHCERSIPHYRASAHGFASTFL
jgi:hypothetical protein